MHGGTHPRGGKAPQSSKNVKTGRFKKFLTDEEKQRFAEILVDMIDDPALELLKDAAFLRTVSETVAARADENGLYVAAQSGVTRTEPLLDETGTPVMYKPFDDSNEKRPVMKTTTTISAERRDVIGPVSELLMRSGRLVEAAIAVKKKDRDGDDPAKSGKTLDRETALAITRDVFREGGNLEPREPSGGADGPVSQAGPARSS